MGENLLKLPDHAQEEIDEQTQKVRRFFAIAVKLNLDLQEQLCQKISGSIGLIPFYDKELAFINLAKLFCLPNS